MRALIDGDILRYRIGFACQTTFYDVMYKPEEEWGPVRSFNNKTDMNKWLKTQVITDEDKENFSYEERVEAEPVQNCLHSVKLQVNSIIAGAKANEYRVLLSGKNNFRDTLVDYYKANRDRNKRPVHYDAITEYLIKYWDARIVHDREADDALSILQYNASGDGALNHAYSMDNPSTIICTIDKDLDITPGWHYNFVKDETYFITELEGYRNFYMQMLQGDVADNIPGLSRITGTRRKKGEWDEHKQMLWACDNEYEMWDYVFDTYIQTFSSINALIPEYTTSYDAVARAVIVKLSEIGKLLWMQRSKDDDWEPPQ